MKENKYDDPVFFEQYRRMARSEKGLEGAGEWYVLKGMLPDLKDKDLLDLGCGFGWHCRYAIEHDARSVVGIDISEKMLCQARQINDHPGIEYVQKPLEEVAYDPERFDIVLSSLTFHYVASFDAICRNVYTWLKPEGRFIFSVEHPVFTAAGKQDWTYDEHGNKTSWPVDKYFYEGEREAVFLGEKIVKYHRTLTSYLNGLLKHGFVIQEIIEPQPSQEMTEQYPDMKDEMRRPMMLLISAVKS